MRLLTQKQERFCLKYIECSNATEAAIIAGYSPRSSASTAAIVLTKPNVKARIAELRQLAVDESIATVIERKQRLTEMIRANVTDFVDEEGNITLDVKNKGALAELNVEDWQSVGNVSRSRTKKIKLHSPIQAISELNKMEHVYEPESKTINYNDIKILVVYDDQRDNSQITEAP